MSDAYLFVLSDPMRTPEMCFKLVPSQLRAIV